jgi:hypothetical protein
VESQRINALVMSSRFQPLRVVALLVVLSSPALRNATGQEALRNALLTDASAQFRNEPPVRPPGDFLRIGPASFDIGVGYFLEASDNIRYTETDRKSDLINRPWLRVGLNYAISSKSRLTFSGQFGYLAYVKHSEFDTFFIAPNSELAYDFKLKGDAILTVYDRIDYSQDIATEAALAGVAEFKRIQNLAGVRAVWARDKWLLQGGYGHLNVWGVGENLNYLDRSDEQLFSRVGYQFNTSAQAGMEASASFSDYVLATQHDRITVSVGPYGRWEAGKAFQISVRGGVVESMFESTSSGGGDTDVTSYYLGLDLDHHLTRHITHGLSARHDVQAGVNPGTDFIESTRLDYHLAWALVEYATLNFAVFGELSEDHRVGGSTTAVSESYSRTGASAQLTYRMTDHFSGFARYAFVLRDSDLPLRSYTENRAGLGLEYRF